MTHRVAKTTLPRNGRGLADCDCQASAVNKHGSERIYWFSYRTVGLGWGELRVLDQRPASRYESQAERIILSTVVNTQDDYNVSESASQLTSGYWHVAPLIAAHCAKPPDAGRAEEWGDLQRPPCLLR